MSKYEAKFVCVWCGDVPLDDVVVENRLNNEELGRCPRCNKFSWCNSIKAKFEVYVEKWERRYGSSK